ncbi:class II glutamine amidotransferase [Actinoplanes sp. KI2]|uniref:class II glutamine amidotransferase n=1 Tax=Actinoplanes sp. KI2 TaxID=2983315 RepID=UPI0021D5772A|nr:class II glutamine amidotransferase [Actinoplanes sp. KI2]MCU7729120.1 class II glutamine amidotransferase [Actinoplanes sp. KI2]
MCRLFGLTAAPRRVAATFWLLDASDSLAVQSRREPDGVGLGVFGPDGTPEVHKAPIAAYQDPDFAREAREERAATFVAHIRYASTGGLTPANTHPFDQHDRLLAHNGVIGGLPRLEDHLGPAMSLVHGDTDSERLFALITTYAERTGDVAEAITRAVRWTAANLPVYAVNLILTTATDLWALRYPETHELYVLPRGAGGPSGNRHLDHASAAGTVRVRSADLAVTPAVVVASERMDEDPGWRALEPGELLHVGPGGRVRHEIALPEPPAHRLTLADLSPHAQASQKPAPAG